MVLAAKAKHGDPDLAPWHRRIQRSLLTFSSFTASRLEQDNCPPMSEKGHSLPSHLAPVPANVRCYSNSGQTRVRLDCPLSAKSRHRDKLFWTSVGIPTTCRCHHSARACAVSGAVMPVPCGLTTVYPLIDRTCSRVKPWPELPSCTSQLLPPTWFISTNT
jgi:hypothetical protein